MKELANNQMEEISFHILETKRKTEKFIESLKILKRRKSIRGLRITNYGESVDWFYFYCIVGFLNGEYFSVDINCNKIINHVRVKIVDTTDCKEEILNLLYEFELLHH